MSRYTTSGICSTRTAGCDLPARLLYSLRMSICMSSERFEHRQARSEFIPCQSGNRHVDLVRFMFSKTIEDSNSSSARAILAIAGGHVSWRFGLTHAFEIA